MNEDQFFHQIQLLYQRVSALQKNTSTAPEQHQEWLPVALAELNTAFEELQVAEEELRAQNEALAIAHRTVEAERRRYQELFEFAPDGYLVTDRNGKIQEANRATANLLNISQQFLVGKLLISFLTQEARPVLRAALTQLNQGTQEQEWVVRLQPRRSSYISNNSKGSLPQELGGQPFNANLKMVAVRDPAGKLVALRCLVRDITERQQMLETLIRSRVAESTNQALEKEISERKRVEAEREALLIQLDHKQRLLEAVLQQMPAGVTIAEASSGQLILANEESARILGHSFLPTDESKANTKLGAIHPDGQSYELAEYPQRRSRISGEVVKGEEMYYVRGDGTRTILSVSSAPVRDSQGGTIATVGTFYDISERKQAEGDLVTVSPSLDGLEVIVVDDEADSRELLTTVLEQAGARVTAVASAAAALGAITNAENPSGAQQFDVLLCDISMPGEDGYTLIRKVRARSPEQGGQISAIALTAYAREEDRSQALSTGFQMHISKPVSPTELIAVVASLTERAERV